MNPQNFLSTTKQKEKNVRKHLVPKIAHPPTHSRDLLPPISFLLLELGTENKRENSKTLSGAGEKKDIKEK